MKRAILIGLIIPLFAFAKQKDKPDNGLEVFSGTNYVRAVITAPTNNVSNYQATITSIKDNKVLWQGKVEAHKYTENGKEKVSLTVTNLSPVLWTPTNPYLYELTIKPSDGINQSEMRRRVGFRIFETHDGNLYLNHKPIFLRGIAINPPGRGIPAAVEKSREFALEYVKFMKSIHVNIIRIPDDENWYNVCDELGMMVFGGNYSGSVDEKKPPVDYDKAVAWYEEDKFGPISHHPSLMIYAMTNEVEYGGKLGDAWQRFLKYAHGKLKTWDETRLYIGNAGYGFGVAGDICDLHRYWGWYYNSPYTFLHVRNNSEIIPFKKPVQPITFTECVGNYTGPDGRYNLTPDHKNPGSQLNWTGHAPENEQAHLADEHQSFTFQRATETFRQLRTINPELSGIFPFTILFYNWDTVEKFADMHPKPVTEQTKISYQPVLLSWECYTPQVYAGSSIKPVLHIINDDDDFNDLKGAKAVWEITDKAGKVYSSESLALPEIKYYGAWMQKLNVKIPATLATGNYSLSGKILQGDKVVSHNIYPLFVANTSFVTTPKTTNVLLYDPSGKTAAAFNQLKIAYKPVTSLSNLNANSTLVIGENAAGTALAGQALTVKQFVANGGRVLALRQDSLHLPNLNAILNHPVKNVVIDLDNPKYTPQPRPSRNGYYINPERPDNEVFAGIDREKLKVWSDYTDWDLTQKGFPAVYPVTDGYVVGNKDDIKDIAVLGNFGVALESIAIGEMFNGKGSVLVTGLDLINREGKDPVATRMLTNLVAYTNTSKGHEKYPLISETIRWGVYETEKGVLTGVNSGLMVNPKAILKGKNTSIKTTITAEGHEIAGAPSGFNTRPGIQYVAYGRRAWGPYYLRGFGNIPAVADADKNNNIGKAQFWCRIPQGQRTSITKVWNPADVPLNIKITVNGQSVDQEVKAGETVMVNCPVNSSTVGMQFSADRRMVILETTFK
ncbi:glycoside hydrolase family 2 TIM barrel-domain containing protein [Mucilaginibacter boryungensis]|uniref:Glycosyl hydrolase family 2 n=2 Tax=Mucilaginibacter boryungensis TaxID=768480 RepID=A0ABR9XGN9_9SPHI|nr:glycoside hydrolase family 2 TIM barrel-domain containing protein [Mucilaginibacter boryungensis]MBE9666436.1 glycosyl hydrolase family 2 [Mucilaginibacter boryungensis]